MSRARAESSQRRRSVGAAASWEELAERAGSTGLFGPEDFRPGLSLDARMVATLHNVTAQIRKSAQLFLTNGYLGSWSRDLAQALRRLGTPRARTLAALHAELAAIGEVACVREGAPEYVSDEHGQFDPVLEVLAHELEKVRARVLALDEPLRRDIAARLEGARARTSARPWPRAPRLSRRIRNAWG